jgi:hypothetical protein
MTRKLKALGMALFAVMAMGAFSASMASANFHSESSHTIIDGKQPVAEDDVFTVNAGTVKCTEASYSGTQNATTTSAVSVVPKYTGCTAFGFVNAPIDVVDCEYEFTATTTTLHIRNVPNKTCKITVTAFNCHVSLGAQTLTGITYDNAGSEKTRDVTATANISNIKYTQESKSFPGCTNGTFTNGTYKGSGTVTGTNTAGEQVGIWHG